MSTVVLHLPDSVMARFMRLAERLVYAITADRAAAAGVAEIADIFESGPPFTDTVREMFRESEAEFAGSAVRCLLAKSPYGAL